MAQWVISLVHLKNVCTYIILNTKAWWQRPRYYVKVNVPKSSWHNTVYKLNYLFREGKIMTPWTWDPSQVLSLEDFSQNKNEIVKKILIVCISQVDTTFKRQSLVWVTLYLWVYLKRASGTPFLYLSFSPSFSPLFHLPSSFLLPGHEVTVLFSFFFLHKLDMMCLLVARCSKAN